MPFGLQTKSLIVGAVAAVVVVPYIVAKINSRKS